MWISPFQYSVVGYQCAIVNTRIAQWNYFIHLKIAMWTLLCLSLSRSFFQRTGSFDARFPWIYGYKFLSFVSADLPSWRHWYCRSRRRICCSLPPSKDCNYPRFGNNKCIWFGYSFLLWILFNVLISSITALCLFRSFLLL